ncbi:Uncharacterised protein [Legionella steigerwaltii]|uniref:Uncharacterized protein n=1 Tax=Legionella steigerwaltii TaxID=460 RepID=A0A378L498_9GAMM|nr:hypothetical protein [Legionella steigerwaltii]KTD75399.1 hypothetical protein Lstg_2494 [Legionella steigerwaltii]STY21507.1 Uncharacterised protein [Legionella steigerwaltii]
MIDKLELTRQYQEKQEQIRVQREKIAALQKTKLEKEKKIEEYNQKNATIITTDIPHTLKQAQLHAGPSKQLDTKNKELVLAYIAAQFTIISDAEKQYKDEAHPEKTQKLLDFLYKVQAHLDLGYKAYGSKVLAKLANESGILSHQEPANTGFQLMLEILEEDKSNYVRTWASTDYENLSRVVPKKIADAEFAQREDQRCLEPLSDAAKALEELKIKLNSNYDERDKLSTEVTQLSAQINEIDRVTIKGLTDQAADINQRIKETEQREQQELERQQQLKKREELATEFKQMLFAYQSDRNQHYHAKDFFDSRDKDSRDKFIDDFANDEKMGLKAYIDSGNSDILLQKITTKMDEFQGVKMQATLSRIALKLMEADANPENVENLPEKAKEVLLALQRKKGKCEAYALKMQGLYEKIKGIEIYAATLPEPEKGTIKKLTEDLAKDVDQFVYQNKAEIPGKEAYQKFEMKVKARLHSQDDVMSEHKSWPARIANFLFSVVTLGKLIVSKVRTGRATPFFDKTAAQKEIEAPVDAALEDIRSLFENN